MVIISKNQQKIQGISVVIEMSINTLVICTCAIIISPVHLQLIQYATRFRNFTIESETDNVYLIDKNIYRKNFEHYLSFKINVTKDLKAKSAQATFYRCVYEKAECEYFLKWTVDRKRLRQTFNMKNQFYSPAVESFKPPINLPNVQKGIYENENVTLDIPAVLLFYPEAMNYYFQLEGILFDFAGKKSVIMWVEVEFYSFAKRNRHRNRGNSSTRS